MRRTQRRGERRRRQQDRVLAMRAAVGYWDAILLQFVASAFEVPTALIIHPDALRPAPRRRGR